jgi:hypothetical protein
MWISLAVVLVGLLLGGIAWWSALFARVPVQPAIANGALVLTSRSQSPWTARVTTSGVVSTVDIGTLQVVQVPIPAGARSFEIELLRPGVSQPGWTITYEPPHAVLSTGGIDAGAGYSVSVTLTEQLKSDGK